MRPASCAISWTSRSCIGLEVPVFNCEDFHRAVERRSSCNVRSNCRAGHALDSAQQSRHLLQRHVFGAVLKRTTAKPNSPVADLGYGCGHDGVTPMDGCLCNILARSGAAFLTEQGFDIAPQIETVAGIAGIGLRANLVSAHIRIKSLGLHTQHCTSYFASIQSGSFILIILIKIYFAVNRRL